MADAELRESTTHLGQLFLVHLVLTFASDEVMPATIGVELTEQAVYRDRLLQAEKARHRAFFFDQKSLINLPGGIIQRDDEVEIVPQRGNPAMLRAILE